MTKKFYITTTLPYVNEKPHIGFALEIIQADAQARYHRLLGQEVFFNTGTDEHGLKVYRKALEEKKDPKKYVDEYAKKYAELKIALNLSFNNFIRTTDTHHIQAAKTFWKKCLENGDIYKAKQKIKYCVGCELEKTDSELENGKCPIHPNRPIEIIEEENYFFRFSKYQEQLLRIYGESPDFVIPKSKLNEIKNFVAQGLKDFSISRLKEKLPWGIEVPDDPKHIIYVWFDALINYISAIGWPDNTKEYEKWWPGVQVAGKDNLRQQSAMWQAMLLSAGLENSKQIFIHGFITFEGQKISKSLGNIVDPFNLVEKYGTDAVRYYLLREIPAYGDGDFSLQRFKEVYNADLANGLGNLVARVAKLCQNSTLSFPLKEESVIDKNVAKSLDSYNFSEALEKIWQVIHNADNFINQEKVWEQKGEASKKSLVFLVLEIRKITYNIKPFLPEIAEKIQKQFSAPKIKSGKPLFPRIK
jgi:methionyl-tRNA synthetase